jgi:predicted extracellular nuclease
MPCRSPTVVGLAAVPAAASSQELVVARIHDIQGAAHVSPLSGQDVAGVEGIVTVERSSQFWMQDPTPDADEATSEGILVFGSGVGAIVNVGDHVTVSGRVLEFRPGGASGTDNLTTTEITSPGLSVTVLSSGNPYPPPPPWGRAAGRRRRR